MDAIEATTRMMLRLQEAHREREGQTDLDAGYRTGLLHALNIAIQLKNDAETEARLKAEAATR